MMIDEVLVNCQIGWQIDDWYGKGYNELIRQTKGLMIDDKTQSYSLRYFKL